MVAYFSRSLQIFLVFHPLLWKWPLQGHVAWVSVSAPGFRGWKLASYVIRNTICCCARAMSWKCSIFPSFNRLSLRGLVTLCLSLPRTLKKVARRHIGDEGGLESQVGFWCTPRLLPSWLHKPHPSGQGSGSTSSPHWSPNLQAMRVL